MHGVSWVISGPIVQVSALVQECGVLVHVSGHIEVTDIGPLGSALWGQPQVSHFAGAFELSRQDNGCLGIQTAFFRHL
jgi:hypothetical protein